MTRFKSICSTGLVCLFLASSSLSVAAQDQPAEGMPPGMPPGGMPPGMPPGGMPPGMPPGGMPPGMPPGGMPAMPSTADTEYSAAIYVEDGQYLADRSTSKHVSGGAVGDTSAEGMSIKADKQDFSGVFVRGEKSIFELSDATLELDGDGTNDFLGLGSGVMAEGGSTVILKNVNITMNGVIAAGTIATRDAVMRVYDSEIRANGGTLPDDFVPVIGPGMKTPPAPLGITGTARTNVTMGNAKSYFYNSTIIAEGWGALSTDACGGDVYLEANNSDIIVNNSGYGIYSDNGCKVVINDSRIKSATFGGILAGVAYLELNNTEVDAVQSSMMIHSVMGRPSESASIRVKGGTHVSKEATFLVKSANLELSIDGANLQPANGNLIRSIVNDDSNATKVNGAETPGIKVTLKNMTLNGNILHEDIKDRNMAVSLVDTQLTGAVSGAELELDEGSKWTATGDSQVSIQRLDDLDQIDALPGVAIMLVGNSHPMLANVNTLRSGGTLVHEDPSNPLVASR